MNVAQCVFPRLNVDTYTTDPLYKATIQELVAAGVGGFCVFRGTLESAASVLSELQFIATTPLLFCADFEHGLPMRLTDGGTAFPHHMALAKASAKNAAKRHTYRSAKAIAQEARSIGIL